jgi:hypothetical protein
VVTFALPYAKKKRGVRKAMGMLKCVVTHLPPIQAMPLTLAATSALPLRAEIESGVLARSASRLVVNPMEYIHTEWSGDAARA